MKQRPLITTAIATLIIAIIAITAIASSKHDWPRDEDFYKHEGGHWEIPLEFWNIAGRLTDEAGNPYYFSTVYNRTGNLFLHTRNGYNWLATPDGQSDYRSYGHGYVKGILLKKLNLKLQQSPDDASIQDTIDRVTSDTSTHFTLMTDNQSMLHRYQLLIDFLDNHIARTSTTQFAYNLRAGTWAGLLTADMKSSIDPITFETENPIRMGTGSMIGYAMPILHASATIALPDGTSKKLTGKFSMEHYWGQPDPNSFKRFLMITLRLSNGSLLHLVRVYDPDNIISGQTSTYMHKKTTAIPNWSPKLKETAYWKSPVTGNNYPIAFDIDSPQIKGKIEPVFQNAEMMIDRGIGGFWYGPCRFKGSVIPKPYTAKNLTGEGFCRIVGYDNSK